MRGKYWWGTLFYPSRHSEEVLYPRYIERQQFYNWTLFYTSLLTPFWLLYPYLLCSAIKDALTCLDGKKPIACFPQSWSPKRIFDALRYRYHPPMWHREYPDIFEADFHQQRSYWRNVYAGREYQSSRIASFTRRLWESHQGSTARCSGPRRERQSSCSSVFIQNISCIWVRQTCRWLYSRRFVGKLRN